MVWSFFFWCFLVSMRRMKFLQIRSKFLENVLLLIFCRYFSFQTQDIRRSDTITKMHVNGRNSLYVYMCDKHINIHIHCAYKIITPSKMANPLNWTKWTSNRMARWIHNSLNDRSLSHSVCVWHIHFTIMRSHMYICAHVWNRWISFFFSCGCPITLHTDRSGIFFFSM